VRALKEKFAAAVLTDAFPENGATIAHKRSRSLLDQTDSRSVSSRDLAMVSTLSPRGFYVQDVQDS
jgi:hypothetical protein